MKFRIQRCTKDDVKAYAEHASYHLTERGINDVLVHPFPADHRRDIPEFINLLLSRWNKEPMSPEYETAWVAIVDGKFVGHLNLRCGGITATAHRMRLGMGIEAPYRSKGIGSGLLTAALNWAREQDSISWIDLGVFAKNHAARGLYKKHGFTETVTVIDALRVDDEIIDDVQMVLKLK